MCEASSSRPWSIVYCSYSAFEDQKHQKETRCIDQSIDQLMYLSRQRDDIHCTKRRCQQINLDTVRPNQSDKTWRRMCRAACSGHVSALPTERRGGTAEAETSTVRNVQLDDLHTLVQRLYTWRNVRRRVRQSQVYLTPFRSPALSSFVPITSISAISSTTHAAGP